MKIFDRIQDPIWRAFAWRVYNTLVATIIPFIFLPILLEIQNSLRETGDLSCFGDSQFWLNLAFIAVAAIVTALIAGINKVNRMENGAI